MYRLLFLLLFSPCLSPVVSASAQGHDMIAKSEYLANQLRKDAIDYRDRAAYVRKHVSNIRSRMMRLQASDSTEAEARLDAIQEIIGSWDAAAQAWAAAAKSADIAAQAWDAVEEMYREQERHVPGRVTRPMPQSNRRSGVSTP